MLDFKYVGKILKNIAIILIYIILVYFGIKIAFFYTPFLVAFIISLAIEPLIRWIMRKLKLTRKISSIIVFIIVLCIILGVLIWGITSLVSEASNFLNGFYSNFNNIVDKIQGLISNINLEKFNISQDLQNNFNTAFNDWSSKIFEVVDGAINKVIIFITSIPNMGICIGVSILALYFICTDKIYMLDQLEHHFPQKWVRKIGDNVREISKSLGGYVKAQAILIFISFIISLIGLYIFKIAHLNVRYPLLIAIGIAFVDALPIFGSGSVMIPWAIISAFNGDIKLALGVFILWLIMTIVRQIIEPKIVSGQLGIHPIFTLIAMYTGFKFVGVFGLLLGPIILIVLKSIFSSFIEKGIIKSIFQE